MTRLSLDDSFTTSIPITVRPRGGRKLITVTGEFDMASRNTAARPDSKVVLALARALRWQRQIDAGKFRTIAEIAQAEKVTASYVARLLRTLLYAPAIIDTIVWTDRFQDRLVRDIERSPETLWFDQVARMAKARG